MSFPTPISDFAEESPFGDDVIFTDIHIDPASLPAPAPEATTVVDNSVNEEEENPEEDMDEDESSDESGDDMESEDEPEEAIAPYSTYTSGGSRPRTIVTARRSAIHPQTIFPTTSASPTPTPSSVPSSPISPRYAFTPSPTPLSIPPSPAVEPQPPSPRSPQNIPEKTAPVPLPPPTSPCMTAAEWIEYWHSLPPTHRASTSSAPLPPTHDDPTVSQLIERASNFDLRIMHLEDTVEVLAGPAQVAELGEAGHFRKDCPRLNNINFIESPADNDGNQ